MKKTRFIQTIVLVGLLGACLPLTVHSDNALSQSEIPILQDSLQQSINQSDMDAPGYLVHLDDSLTNKEMNQLGLDFDQILSDEQAIYYVETKEALQKLAQVKEIETVEKNQKIRLQAQASTKPNDPEYFYQEYYLKALGLPDLWKYQQFGSAAVKVAIIDTGIHYENPDFNLKRIVLNQSNIMTDADELHDLNGHGTAVAGIIGAQINNKKLISGAMPNVQIVPYRVIDDSDEGDLVHVIRAIEKATKDRVDVINISLGTEFPSAALKKAIDLAIAQGTLVIAAAGNFQEFESPHQVLYNWPGAYSNVISVGSVDSDTLIVSEFSYHNRYVDVVAPGEGILSLDSDGESSFVSGTSFAAPYVSALAAYAKSVKRSINQNEFRSLLQQTARDLGPRGRDPYYGYGLISFSKVMNLLNPPKASATIQIKNIQVKKGTFAIYCRDIDAYNGVKKIQINVWPYKKTAKRKVYTAVLQKDGSYKISGDIRNHGKLKGTYWTQVTITQKNQQVTKLTPKSFKI